MTQIRNFFLMWTKKFKNGSQKRGCVESDGKIVTGFIQMTSRTHSQTLFGIFSPNESDDKEDPDRKRTRRGWKQQPKTDYETCTVYVLDRSQCKYELSGSDVFGRQRIS